MPGLGEKAERNRELDRKMQQWRLDAEKHKDGDNAETAEDQGKFHRFMDHALGSRIKDKGFGPWVYKEFKK